MALYCTLYYFNALNNDKYFNKSFEEKMISSKSLPIHLCLFDIHQYEDIKHSSL